MYNIYICIYVYIYIHTYIHIHTYIYGKLAVRTWRNTWFRSEKQSESRVIQVYTKIKRVARKCSHRGFCSCLTTALRSESLVEGCESKSSKSSRRSETTMKKKTKKNFKKKDQNPLLLSKPQILMPTPVRHTFPSLWRHSGTHGGEDPLVVSHVNEYSHDSFTCVCRYIHHIYTTDESLWDRAISDIVLVFLSNTERRGVCVAARVAVYAAVYVASRVAVYVALRVAVCCSVRYSTCCSVCCSVCCITCCSVCYITCCSVLQCMLHPLNNAEQGRWVCVAACVAVYAAVHVALCVAVCCSVCCTHWTTPNKEDESLAPTIPGSRNYWSTNSSACGLSESPQPTRDESRRPFLQKGHWVPRMCQSEMGKRFRETCSSFLSAESDDGHVSLHHFSFLFLSLQIIFLSLSESADDYIFSQLSPVVTCRRSYPVTVRTTQTSCL